MSLSGSTWSTASALLSVRSTLSSLDGSRESSAPTPLPLFTHLPYNMLAFSTLAAFTALVFTAVSALPQVSKPFNLPHNPSIPNEAAVEVPHLTKLPVGVPDVLDVPPAASVRLRRSNIPDASTITSIVNGLPADDVVDILPTLENILGDLPTDALSGLGTQKALVSILTDVHAQLEPVTTTLSE